MAVWTVMRYLLVLQWSASSLDDYEALVDMEAALDEALSADAGEVGEVDGHDMGVREMNLFVCTDDPARAFGVAEETLSAGSRWPDVRAAFRPVDGDHFTVLHPTGLRSFSVS